MKKKSLSLWQVIALAVVFGQLLPVLLTSWQTLEQQRQTLASSLKNEHEHLATVLSISLGKALWNMDDATARSLLAAVAEDPRVVRVAMTDLPGKTAVLAAEISHPERQHGPLLSISRSMQWQKESLGNVRLEMDTSELQERLSNSYRHFLIVVAAQVALSLILTVMVFNRRFVVPVKRLLADSAMLAQRQLDKPFVWERDDELGKLGASLESTRQALDTAFKEIEASEQRFRSLANLSSDWYWERDEEDRLVMMSQGFQDLTGIDPKELIGSQRATRSNFHYEPESWKNYKARLAERQPFRNLEWYVVHPNGEVRYGLTSGEPVFDESGRFKGYRGVGKDITAAKLAEAAQDSARRLRRLVEYLPAGAIYIEDGAARMNEAAERLTGYSREEITSVDQWFDKVFSNGSASFREEYEADKARGFPAPREIGIVRRDGTGRTIEFAAYYDESCEVWLLHDITQREEAKAALQQALLEQRAILDNAIIGIYFLKDRVIQRCNRGLEELLGYEPGELDGKSTDIVFDSAESYAEFGRVAYADIAAGRSWIGEWEVVRKDGTKIWCLYHGKAVDPSDIAKGSIWVAKDITERKHTEERLRRTLLEQQALLDNTAIGIAFVRNRTILRTNGGIERILGYASGELDGQSTRRWYASDEEYEALGKALYPHTAAGKVFQADLQLTRKDGTRVWCSLQAKALDGHKIGDGGVCVIQDITAQKESEIALIAAKTELEHSLRHVEQTYREVTVLSELTGFLQACPTAEEAYVAIAKYAPRLFPHGAGALYLIEPAGDLLDEKLRWGHANSVQRFLADQCWALRRGQPFNMETPAESLCCAHLQDQGSPMPYACLPLTAQGKIFGLLFIEHHEVLVSRQAETRHRLAVALAEQTGLALANLRLRETLRQQSIRDPLTGLYNRRHMNEVLQRELARAERNGTPLAAAIIDVDHFKKFNDTFGHDAGDHVLQSVARVLEQTVRQSDIVCRFGGEEFVVLLPEANEQQALGRAADLLDGIRQLKLKHGNRSLGNITASLGLAVYPRHGSSAESLLEAADTALYRAKETGRNRVVVSGFEQEDVAGLSKA